MNSALPTRLLTLDAMRGLAAILVVIYHFDDIVQRVPGGNLAVDFFFLLSGFVIARTYEPRLRAGMPLRTFLTERLIRLYPLFFLGLLIGVARRIGQIFINHPDRMSWYETLVGTGFNALMLPTPLPGPLGTFPLNGPAWSLSFEMLVNLIYAVALARCRTLLVGIFLSVLSVVFVLVFLAEGHVWGGHDLQHMGLGLLRSMFGFTAGVFMSRFTKNLDVSTSPTSVIPFMILGIVLIFSPPPAMRAVYELTLATVILPAIVWFGAQTNPPSNLKRAAQILGDISYPIYVLHYAPLFMASYVARKLHLSPELWMPVFLVGMCAISYYLAHSYDPWARKRLKWFSKTRNLQPQSV